MIESACAPYSGAGPGGDRRAGNLRGSGAEREAAQPPTDSRTNSRRVRRSQKRKDKIGEGPVTPFRATVAPFPAWRGSRFRVDRAMRHEVCRTRVSIRPPKESRM